MGPNKIGALSVTGQYWVSSIFVVQYYCYQLMIVVHQIAFLVASLLGLRRVFFGGSYIRGHKSTMENISYAIDFW
jgi:pantothenate kinase